MNASNNFTVVGFIFENNMGHLLSFLAFSLLVLFRT